MNAQKEFLERIIDALAKAKIPYMLSGSTASSFHGRPRATNDTDIVIAPTREQLNSFIESLGKDYYVSPQAVRQAFEISSIFNIIDHKTGGKADFILRKNRPFSVQEFERRRTAEIEGLRLWTTSPEDVILTKLEWAQNSQSEQQLQDALAVAVVQWERLDKDYLKKWAKDLQIEDFLKRLLEQAEKLIDSK